MDDWHWVRSKAKANLVVTFNGVRVDYHIIINTTVFVFQFALFGAKILRGIKMAKAS